MAGETVNAADLVAEAAQAAAIIAAQVEQDKRLLESIAASVAESEAAGGGGTFIRAPHDCEVKAGFAWRSDGEQGAGYYRDLTEEEKLTAAGAHKEGKTDSWKWNVDMAYRVVVDDVPVFAKIGSTEKPIMVLTLGMELASKSGKRTASGDEWLRVSKNSGIGIKSQAWVPCKLMGKVVVEEVPVDEWAEESGEEDYEVEKITEMR
jgi:hypothetical protein